MVAPTGKGDFPNPLAWQDQNGLIPPSEFNAVPSTTNFPNNGDGRFWWNASSGTYSIPTRVLNHFDGDLVDQAGDATWTLNGAAALSASSQKFGSGCLALNGGAGHNTVSSATAPIVANGPLDVLKGDFCIEAWINPTDLPLQMIFWDYGDFANNGGIRLYPGSNGVVTCQASFFHGWSDITSPAASVTAGTYYHIAVVRHGTVGTLYINGVASGTQNNWVGTNSSGSIVYLGASSNSAIQSTFMRGFIDEFRVSAFARYTANFTPPTGPFTLTDTLPAPITYIGDPTYLTGTLALTWQLTQLSNDGSIPYIFYSLDGGVTSHSVQLPLGTQGLQSGSIDIPLAGATGIIISPKFIGTVVPGATLTNLAIAITRNADEGPVWNYPDALNPVNYNCARLDVNGFPSATLAQLRFRILVRLGFANQAANPPPGMAPLVNDFLLSAQTDLYRRYTALHTRRFFRWKLIPGQRFYSLLDNDEDVLTNYHVDPLKTIEWAGIQDTRNVWYPLIEGIPPQLYTMLSKPWRPARYDIRAALEVYPAPDQTYFLWVKGHFGLLSFVNDSDTTTIDSELVFLHALANAKAHYGQADASNVEAQANTMRGNLVAGTHKTAKYIPGTIAIPPAVRPTLVQFQSNQSG